jgi:predicted HAD superfamily phosphohydrolase
MPVTILIDEARWWWRGKKWCHLVSDSSYDELHAFAERVGIPRRGFQGDHYDIPEEYREELIAAGAEQVESRELVRRLRGAGLRMSPAERRMRSGTEPAL